MHGLPNVSFILLDEADFFPPPLLNKHTLKNQKAQSFVEALTQIPFAPVYIHKLQLILSIDNQYYKELAQQEGRKEGRQYKQV
jgi:hypothetical protein